MGFWGCEWTPITSRFQVVRCRRVGMTDLGSWVVAEIGHGISLIQPWCPKDVSSLWKTSGVKTKRLRSAIPQDSRGERRTIIVERSDLRSRKRAESPQALPRFFAGSRRGPKRIIRFEIEYLFSYLSPMSASNWDGYVIQGSFYSREQLCFRKRRIPRRATCRSLSLVRT